MSLFFAKLVSYTFLFWLPDYISHSDNFSPSISSALSTVFDVGGIVGGVLAGVISDYSGCRAVTCVVMMFFAAPSMFLYQSLGHTNLTVNIGMLALSGALVNGPYSLITTAVSADLGTHPCLHGNAKALATVSAIIDGTGSIGAALGPWLAGFVSQTSWQNVFYLLIASDIAAMLLLLRLATKEILATRCGSSLRDII
jgi:OPA family glycerol-3-phosphate transporter-like MFS transporter 1/2